jgi:hypothetical protein
MAKTYKENDEIDENDIDVSNPDAILLSANERDIEDELNSFDGFREFQREQFRNIDLNNY